MSEIILALDLATTTGWAIGRVGHRCSYGSIRFSKKGSPRAELLCNALEWFEYIIKLYKPHYIIFESPIPSFGKTNFNTTRILVGLAGIVEAKSYQSKFYRVFDLSVVTVRKHLLGKSYKGKEAKLQAIKFTKSYGYNPQDDNAADAIMIWLYYNQLLRGKND